MATRSLITKLSESDKLKALQRIPVLMGEIAQEEAELVNINATYKAKMKTLKADLNRCRAEYSTGERLSDVEVVEYQEGSTYYVIRCDTCQIITEGKREVQGDLMDEADFDAQMKAVPDKWTTKAKKIAAAITKEKKK
jgi:hypothetical protein